METYLQQTTKRRFRNHADLPKRSKDNSMQTSNQGIRIVNCCADGDHQRVEIKRQSFTQTRKEEQIVADSVSKSALQFIKGLFSPRELLKFNHRAQEARIQIRADELESVVEDHDSHSSKLTWFGVVVAATLGYLQLTSNSNALGLSQLQAQMISLCFSVALTALTPVPSSTHFKISILCVVFACGMLLSSAVPTRLFWVPYISCINPVFHLMPGRFQQFFKNIWEKSELAFKNIWEKSELAFKNILGESGAQAG